MFCQKCGSQLNEGVAFCPKCGEKTDAASGIRVQGTNGNSVNISKPKKRIPILLMCIGVIMYGLFAYERAEIKIYWAFCLIGLVEFICAIAYKKAVFVLSIIQAFVFVFMFAVAVGVSISSFGEFGTFSNALAFFRLLLGYIFLPIIACVLLLVGGIMFKKEKAMNKLSGGVQSIVFCQKCGSQLNEGAAFCPKCGAKNDAATGIRGQE